MNFFKTKYRVTEKDFACYIIEYKKWYWLNWKPLSWRVFVTRYDCTTYFYEHSKNNPNLYPK